VWLFLLCEVIFISGKSVLSLKIMNTICKERKTWQAKLQLNIKFICSAFNDKNDRFVKFQNLQ
jgi:hypothetical protein